MNGTGQLRWPGFGLRLILTSCSGKGLYAPPTLCHEAVLPRTVESSSAARHEVLKWLAEDLAHQGKRQRSDLPAFVCGVKVFCSLTTGTFLVSRGTSVCFACAVPAALPPIVKPSVPDQSFGCTSDSYLQPWSSRPCFARPPSKTHALPA